ncbi:GDSL-type esterase/lipase family protein [Ruminococcus sp. Marseille-P6503]|uniref:GDSL-type esterase/lipase family protein n=1 Tax=Ruminococcus sp. Marseille-P6503 TaxID=2364796 RepID=UPI000F5317F7|nr:GDSL-type esterase/lipase family protein [Ruminococcus sp. Marseille-P6503]
MGEPNKSKELRKKRVRLQQYTISVCCLALMVFIMVWVVNVALTGRNIQTAEPSSSRSEQADVKDSSVKKDDSESNTGNESKKADDSGDSEAAVESQSSGSEESGGDSSASEISDDFADAVFIGDSRTVGLGMNTDRPKATFYASTGLNVDTIETSETIILDNGNYGTVYDALKQKQFGRVYVMFGINELGWPYPDVFQEKYEAVINKIKELQPDAVVYVQSILPVSSLALSTNSVFTNENVDNFNLYVQNAAANTGSVYLDVASSLKDENGALPIEASTDGIHLIREYCMKWMDYLAENS